MLVVDAKGAPIETLTSGDFKLFVNGKGIAIDFFEAPPTVRAREAATPVAKEASGAVAAVPAPERRVRSTVFVISDLHVDVLSRNAALNAPEAYADALPAGEPAAVYLLDTGVRRVLGFTADRAALRKALEKPRKRLPRSYVFTETRGTEWVGQSRQMLRNFTTVLDSLASRPESKTVVVVTGPVSPSGLIEPIGGYSAAAARAATLEDPYTGVFMPRGLWEEAKEAEGQALLARATVVALDPRASSPRTRAQIRARSSRPPRWADAS